MPSLLLELSHSNKRHIEIGESLVIGRASDCGLELADPKVSRWHASIRREPSGCYRLLDLGSTGGTFVEGRRIMDTFLHDGDSIQIGDTRLSFEDAEGRSFTMEDITLEPEAFEAPVPAPGHELFAVASEERFARGGEVSDMETLRRDYEKLRAAFELTRAIGVELELPDLLRRILETVLGLVEADRGAVLLVDPQTRRPYLRMARTRSAVRMKWRLSARTVEEVLTHRTGVLLRDPKASGARSVMCVPLLHRAEVLGVLYLEIEGGEGFSAMDLELITTLAAQSALAIRNALLRKRLDAVAQEERQRLARALAELPEGVVLLEGQGRIALMNPRAEALLSSLTPAKVGDPIESIAGHSFPELVARAGLPLEIEGGKPPRLFALSVTRCSGGGAQGNESILVIRDVTADREADERAAAVDRMTLVGQLAGGIAHDFNNLLTVILAITQLCEGSARGLPIAEDIHEIRRAAEAGSHLTRQLLSFARPDEARPEVLDLNHHISELSTLMRKTVGDTSISGSRCAPTSGGRAWIADNSNRLS
jgi:pSer/pThr/pTyr-binding forkhead associated (FHA) protein